MNLHPGDEFSMTSIHRVLTACKTAICVCVGILSLLDASIFADETNAPPETAATMPSLEKPNGASSEVALPANRLSRESSIYLLMHAHNPVDWYPWGPEAFEKARKENKPIFLSIGYSSCYWCHVMERQTFTNLKVADYLNEHFVCIKVDREERPDVDDIYMTSLIVYKQAAGSGGGGGWPLSMFLTQEGDPIAGATYLPPEDTPEGQTGFLTAAGRIHDLWTNNKESIADSATMISREVRRLSGPTVLAEPTPLNRALLDSAVEDIRQRYDSVYGGVDFSKRNPEGPRFPNVPRLMFLLSLYEETSQPELLEMVDLSLTAMAKGGIRDHVGGGFHRYSTDRRWNVPHFEKMLYDQAQLLEVYAHAARVTKNPLYVHVIDELVSFLSREMTLPDGGFCSALDAETNAIEGEYYVWTEEQVRAILKAEDAELFLTTYGFHEPQSFEHGRVLFLPVTVAELAAKQASEAETLEARLAGMRALLLAARNERPRPILDDKVLTEWNALMIQGLAVSGRLPGREKDLLMASKAADFLLTFLKDSNGQLLRSWRNGTAGSRGYLDDYACLASALRALHQSTGEARWLTAATEITEQQIALFYDESQSTFFFTASDQEKLFARTSSPYDSVTPSGNSMTIRNLIDLSKANRNPKFLELAESTLKRFSGTLAASPAACSGLAMALQDLLRLKPLESNAGRFGFPSPSNTGEKVANRPDEGAGLHFAGRTVLTAITAPAQESDKAPPAEGEVQQAFKPVLPDPANPSPFKRNYDERPVKAKIYPYFDKLERGGKCPVAIELTIADDWHINANPASPDFLIPTEIVITSGQKVKMTKVKYPKHELLTVDGQGEPSHVYGGKVLIYGLLEIDAAETAEKAELEVEIKFQACNSKTCEPPDSIKLKGKLTLANTGDEIKRINESRFPKADEKDDQSKDDEKKGADDGKKDAEKKE